MASSSLLLCSFFVLLALLLPLHVRSDAFSSVYNVAINGSFTFYGIGGRGACGWDTDQPQYSVAASGQFFSGYNWVSSGACQDKRTMYNAPICNAICVTVTYKCKACSAAKTYTYLVNNQCPECEPGHLDMSPEAFKLLEPDTSVGHAFNAQVKFVACNSTSFQGKGTYSSDASKCYNPGTPSTSGSSVSPSSLDVQTTLASKWNGGMQVTMKFTNKAAAPICKANVTIKTASGQTLSTVWGLTQVSGNQYALSNSVSDNGGISQNGGTYTGAGMNIAVSGSDYSVPTVTVDSVKAC